MGGAELEDLRWYLEDYLRAPYGVYETRGPRIAELLPTWGRAMFAALLGSGPAREAYVGFRTRATTDLEIVLSSALPERLGMPWELLRDPHLPKPLALDGVGFSRTLPGRHRDDPVAVQGQKLRVLMVIARPRGASDVGYQVIARPLLRRLEAVRGPVELEVLRPPTLEALDSALQAARQAGRPFQIVHFDGHGALTGGTGVLHFERRGEPAHRVAEVLNRAQVPVVVLNACQSGALGKHLEAAVATQLLAGGALAVVAMAYNVYAVAAAEFMTAFYERLFAGDTVGGAVRAGRARLAQRPGRPSPKGELPLEDWAVPVHYARCEVRFPQLHAAPGATVPDAVDRPGTEHPEPQDDPLEPTEEFVGRDGLVHTLETAAGTSRVILLHGPAGTGKTELAKAFGRWWRDTGGVDQPERVLWHAFEPGLASFGLPGVISAIGLRVFGADFARNDPDRRRELVQDELRTHRCLLIWDNFESVASMPDPATPVDDAGRAELKNFLDQVADGRSTVLITSRTGERWLGDVHRVAVGGLTGDEAIDYADHLLAPLPAATPRRADRAFGDLLEWLHGHPLSMRVILPHLETTDAATLLSGLRGAVPLPETPGGDPDDRLPAGLAYSLGHLDAADRRLLVAVGLFDGLVVASMLAAFSKIKTTPRRFRDVDADRWKAVLDRAAHVGLLTTLGVGAYGVHPALPAHLAGRWRAEDPDDFPAQRAAAEHALLVAYTAFCALMGKEVMAGATGDTYRVIGLHRRMLSHLLGHAVEHRLWAQAGTLFSTLREFWNRRGLTAETRTWIGRMMAALSSPDDGPPPFGELSGKLWLFLVDALADDLTRTGQLDAATTVCEEALVQLADQPGGALERDTRAGLCYRLGQVAQQRGQREDAERWHREALTIHEELDNRHGIATALTELGSVARKWARWDEAERHLDRSLALRRELGDRRGTAITLDQLGDVAQARGRWDDAEERYRESLDLMAELGDLDGRGRAYHELGMVSIRRYRFDAAALWFHQALDIAERLNDPRAKAASYHQLGMVAQVRGQFDEADEWYRQALGIKERLRDRSGMAASYQALGALAMQRKQLADVTRHVDRAIAIWKDLDDRRNVAGSHLLLGEALHDHGHWDEAERNYREAIAIQEALKDHVPMAVAYGQLGRLAGDRGDADGALEWTIRSVALFERFPHRTTAPAHHQLARLHRAIGAQALERRWTDITGSPLPAGVREFLEAKSKEDS
ncbi:hypothetical protein ADK67_25515 [Saccharothrix sp. NRRL B-16348]|nr:hypothetical protein ADK67_25515 [Saccharothrix sp. NRRL B-16348]